MKFHKRKIALGNRLRGHEEKTFMQGLISGASKQMFVHTYLDGTFGRAELTREKVGTTYREGVMGLPDLEVKCWRCWGSGVISLEDHAEAIDCPECEGLGWIVTEDGQRLLDFLERHFIIESD